MLTNTLIDIARSRLGDEKKQRWSDRRLITLVNQGQASICKLTGIYRKEAYIQLLNGVHRYKLPDDCMTLRRIEYKGEYIEVLNRNDLDRDKQSPQDFVGIKDNLGMGKLDIYPAVLDLTSDVLVVEGISTGDIEFKVTPPTGVVTSFSELFDVQPIVGVVAGMEYNTDVIDISALIPTVFGEVTRTPAHSNPGTEFDNTPYGVTTGISWAIAKQQSIYGFITQSGTYEVVGAYGLVASIVDADHLMRVYYDAVPTSITNLADSLVIAEMWEDAMVRYIVGNALQDDNDANNIQRGELELQKYIMDIEKARELATKDFSGGMKSKYLTTYRRT